MRLDEVLPELMGSLALSELFFRGEGPPRACRRMDQYQRKMKKPMGSEGAQGSVGGGGAALPLPLLPTQATSTPVVWGYPTMHQTLCHCLGPISLDSLEVLMRSGLFITILFHKRGN